MQDRVILGWDFSLAALEELVECSPVSPIIVTRNPRVIDAVEGTQGVCLREDPFEIELSAKFANDSLCLLGVSDQSAVMELAKKVRTELPEAFLIGFSPDHRAGGFAAEFSTTIDRFIEFDRATADRIISTLEWSVVDRAPQLRSVLREIDGTLAIFTHDNPDPDAIASAQALSQLADAFGVESSRYYFGAITHQSNRALMNALDLQLESIEIDAPLPDWDAVALVDHALPGVNNSLPEQTAVDLVFDHHPPSGIVSGKFVDIRDELGATSTLLAAYLSQFDIKIDRRLATALLYGIRTDTRDFSRKMTELDFRTIRQLWPNSDHDLLGRVESPQLSTETVDLIAKAIENRNIRQNALFSFVGQTRVRDALGQAADLLLELEGVDITAVSGIYNGEVHVSARSHPRGGTIDLATVMRDAFGQIGSAGGHERMAGATIDPGLLGERLGDPFDQPTDFHTVLEERFFEALEMSIPGSELTGG